jgi:Molybdate transporter of MFS superfamily
MSATSRCHPVWRTCCCARLARCRCATAGGLAAQFRFDARTGLAPIIFGVVLLVLAVGFADHAATLFALIPIGAVGALLIFAGTDLAISRHLFDWQAVMLVGDRDYGFRNRDCQPGSRLDIGVGFRIDPRGDRQAFHCPFSSACYKTIPYASRTGNSSAPYREVNRPIREFSSRISEIRSLPFDRAKGRARCTLRGSPSECVARRGRLPGVQPMRRLLLSNWSSPLPTL